jgi:hypothetical protein
MADHQKPPPSGLGPSGPVSAIDVLAAIARAELHERRVAMHEIANHLGWRFSGAATVRLRPVLGRLVGGGQVSTEEPPPHKRHSQEWRLTADGRGRLAADGPVDLPESPLHRRWRQDRDVASWAMDAVRSEARQVVDEAHDILTDLRTDPPFTEGASWRLTMRFRDTMGAFALATQMCERWPEPTDSAGDIDPNQVSVLLPGFAKGRRK